MIRLKRVYVPSSPEDGARFLVERLWPRGLRKDALALTAWLKDVAPSHALRRLSFSETRSGRSERLCEPRIRDGAAHEVSR